MHQTFGPNKERAALSVSTYQALLRAELFRLSQAIAIATQIHTTGFLLGTVKTIIVSCFATYIYT